MRCDDSPCTGISGEKVFQFLKIIDNQTFSSNFIFKYSSTFICLPFNLTIWRLHPFSLRRISSTFNRSPSALPLGWLSPAVCCLIWCKASQFPYDSWIISRWSESDSPGRAYTFNPICIPLPIDRLLATPSSSSSPFVYHTHIDCYLPFIELCELAGWIGGEARWKRN